jgi:hypothetical protein
VPVGGVSSNGTIFTADSSKLSWQIASPAAAFEGQIPDKYPYSPVYMFVKPISNPATSVQFHIEAMDFAVAGDVYEFYIYFEDPSRGISRVASITVTIVD